MLGEALMMYRLLRVEAKLPQSVCIYNYYKDVEGYLASL